MQFLKNSLPHLLWSSHTDQYVSYFINYPIFCFVLQNFFPLYKTQVTCSHHLNHRFWSGGFLLNGSTEPSIYKLSSRAPRFFCPDTGIFLIISLSGYGQFMLSTSFLPLHGCITATDSVLQKMLEVGTKASDFELPDQNGELHKLSNILERKQKRKTTEKYPWVWSEQHILLTNME